MSFDFELDGANNAGISTQPHRGTWSNVQPLEDIFPEAYE
jgi:hypothetical protein